MAKWLSQVFLRYLGHGHMMCLRNSTAPEGSSLPASQGRQILLEKVGPQGSHPARTEKRSHCQDISSRSHVHCFTKGVHLGTHTKLVNDFRGQALSVSFWWIWSTMGRAWTSESEFSLRLLQVSHWTTGSFGSSGKGAPITCPSFLPLHTGSGGGGGECWTRNSVFHLQEAYSLGSKTVVVGARGEGTGPAA